MNTNTTESSNFGEYPATSTKKVAQETFQTTTDAIPTSTEDLAQYDTTTNEVGLDSQFNLASNNEIQEPFTDFKTEGDFASVKVLPTDDNTTNLQVADYNAEVNTNTATTNFDTNAQFDLGMANTGFESGTDFVQTTTTTTTNTFTENTENNFGGIDVLQGTANATEYGEYQASSPIIDTAESAQITGNANLENLESFGTGEATSGAEYNFNTFQSVEENVDLGGMTTSTPIEGENNFDFTTSDSVIGATSALNNIESTNYIPSEPVVETTTNYEVNNVDYTASAPVEATTSTFDVNAFTSTENQFVDTTTDSQIQKELVDPVPIETGINFATQQSNYNEYQASNTTENIDINAFTTTSTEQTVDTTPAFDTTDFAQAEPVAETTTNVDLNAFTTTEQTVDTTPAFDTTAFTQAEPVAETTTNVDLNAFTTTEQTVDTTPAFDTTDFAQAEPVVETTTNVDLNTFTTTEQTVDTTPAFDTTAFTQSEQTTTYQESTPAAVDTGFSITNLPPLENIQTSDTQFDFANLQSTPVVDTTSAIDTTPVVETTPVIDTTPAVDTQFDLANLASTPAITTENTFSEYQTTNVETTPVSIPEQFTVPEPVNIEQQFNIPEQVSIPEQYTAPQPISIPETTTTQQEVHIPELYTTMETKTTNVPEQIDIPSLTPPLDLPEYTPTVPITTPTPVVEQYTPPVEIQTPTPAPIPAPSRPTITVKVPKVQKVIVPKIKRVVVPSKKKIIVKRPATTTIKVPRPVTTTVTRPRAMPVPVPVARPQPIMTSTIPQRTIVQKPVPVPVPVQAPVQMRPVAPPVTMPMQTTTIPYSIRTIGASSYRPSLQLQPTQNIVPYKQTTYRPGIKTKRPGQVRRVPVPVPVATIPAPIPNVQSYKPVNPVTLPAPIKQSQVIARPPVVPIKTIQPPVHTVRQIQRIPAQTAVVSQVQQPTYQVPVVPQAVPVQQRPYQVVSQTPTQAVPIVQRPVQPVQVARPPVQFVRPQVQTVRAPVQTVRAPVQTVRAPVQTVRAPVQTVRAPVPVQTVRAPVPVQTVRPPVANVTPMNIAPVPVQIARPPVANVTPMNIAPAQLAQPLTQNPLNNTSTYKISTYRPTMRRNYGNMGGYRPVAQPINTMAQPTGYTTRTYRPRRL